RNSGRVQEDRTDEARRAGGVRDREPGGGDAYPPRGEYGGSGGQAVTVRAVTNRVVTNSGAGAGSGTGSAFGNGGSFISLFPIPRAEHAPAPEFVQPRRSRCREPNTLPLPLPISFTRLRP